MIEMYHFVTSNELNFYCWLIITSVVYLHISKDFKADIYVISKIVN
jgi:hypothetical protein